MMETVVLAVSSGGESIPWLAPAIAFLTIALGGGGIAALLRLRHDKRMGIAQQETTEDDAISNRWKAIIETQTKVLLEPMREELSATKSDLAGVKVEMREMKAELEASRRKYWSAISYIRSLLTWIARHMPESIETTQVPPAPAIVVEDI
jgi:hypothetical protein